MAQSNNVHEAQFLIYVQIPFTFFLFLLLIIPASAVDTDKWDLVAHKEIVPQQSFPVENYSITLAEREKNGLDDYTVN